jgi:N-acetylglucosamine malate deacetylase 1
MKNLFGNSLCVIAPHPDDEVLGCGGLIARASLFDISVHVLFISGHLPPLYPKDSYGITVEESKKSSKILGVETTQFLDIPATFVNEKPASEINSLIKSFLNEKNAYSVAVPFPDRHIDHKITFESAMVACRPVGSNYPRLTFCYETLSETDWNAPYIEANFVPEMFVDISDVFEKKISALNCYSSQISSNSSRNLSAVEALAKYRGSQNGFEFAEGFKIIRHLV